jgi:hypothetical protein
MYRRVPPPLELNRAQQATMTTTMTNNKQLRAVAVRIYLIRWPIYFFSALFRFKMPKTMIMKK